MASEMASCARMECLWTIRGCGCGDDVLIVKPHHRPVFAVMYSQPARPHDELSGLSSLITCHHCPLLGLGWWLQSRGTLQFLLQIHMKAITQYSINNQPKQVAVVDLSLNPYIFAALQIQLCMEEYFKYIEGLHQASLN